MKIFVVNLKRSVDRKEFMLSELSKLSDYFESCFFEAIDINENRNKFYKTKYTSMLTKYLIRKDLTDGEVGCFASHYLLWQECLKLDEPIIVLEDDVVLQEHFEEGIKRIQDSGLHYVKLASTKIFAKNRGKTNRIISENFILSTKWVDGAQGYFITPHIAQIFLKYAKKWYRPVDNYMESYWIHNVPTITYDPRLIEDPPGFVPTTIDNRKKTKVPVILRITSEFCNLVVSIRRCIKACLLRVDI